MKVLILYKPNSEHDTPVQAYAREFEHRSGKTLELVDAESVQGVELAKLYDVLQFPTMVATEEDGQFIQAWPELDKWPTMSELTFYIQP